MASTIIIQRNTLDLTMQITHLGKDSFISPYRMNSQFLYYHCACLQGQGK